MLAGLRARTARALAAALLGALAACSTLPPPTQEAHRDHHVAAEFVVADNGRLLLPSSSGSLVVREFVLQPPPLAEHFHEQQRWFQYAPGTRVTVTGRFRTYATGGGGPAGAATVLAGARSVRSLDTP